MKNLKIDNIMGQSSLTDQLNVLFLLKTGKAKINIFSFVNSLASGFCHFTYFHFDIFTGAKIINNKCFSCF